MILRLKNTLWLSNKNSHELILKYTHRKYPSYFFLYLCLENFTANWKKRETFDKAIKRYTKVFERNSTSVEFGKDFWSVNKLNKSHKIRSDSFSFSNEILFKSAILTLFLTDTIKWIERFPKSNILKYFLLLKWIKHKQ